MNLSSSRWLKNPNLYLVALLLLAAYVLFFGLGQGSLWDWDEAIYASVAKDLLRTGDWLSLHMNGRYWPEKPPLILWLTALVYQAWGVNELAARLVSALSAFGTVVLTYLLGKILFDRWIGFIAGLFLVASPHFALLGRMGMLDAPLLFFLALALYFFWNAQPGKVWCHIAAGIGTGLAVLSKGLVGFFPLVIIALYFLLSGQAKQLRGRGFWLMVATALLLALPWHLHQTLVHGRAFAENYFAYHQWRRLWEPLEGHAGTVFYYLKYTAQHYFAPWMVLAAVILTVYLFRWLARKREPSRAELFLLTWLLGMIVFFSLARTKIAGYILPAYVPLVVLTAHWARELAARKFWKIVLGVVLLLSAIQGLLLQPLGWTRIDKSAAVKSLSRVSLDPNAPLLVLDLPPNAPSFYFAPRVVYAGGLEQAPDPGEAVYVLCPADLQAGVAKKFAAVLDLQILGYSPDERLVLLQGSRRSAPEKP